MNILKKGILKLRIFLGEQPKAETFKINCPHCEQIFNYTVIKHPLITLSVESQKPNIDKAATGLEEST